MNRVLLGVAVAVAAMSMSGCATSGSSASGAAERLERSSSNLERTAYEERARPGFRRDAEALAYEARQFRATLHDARANNRDVRDAFGDLSRRYHAMRDEVERSRSREMDRDFRPVTEAYLDIQREMERAPRDRYARDY